MFRKTLNEVMVAKKISIHHHIAQYSEEYLNKCCPDPGN